MARITAVELGADTCAFARTSVRGGAVHVSAAEILDPAAFPGGEAFTMALRMTRRSFRLPRRCRAVIWGLPDGATRKDPAVKPLLEPLIGAGFRIERVVSPCNALAALARLKTARGEGSMCWLAINRGGVAIVVVRPGKLLYAHSFAWDSSVGASGSQARLLQRYSLVSFLAPEVKRAMAEARKSGRSVDAIVTCGNLPDLRSLTMPLIEELDVEVETLDSLDGLIVKPEAAEKLAEAASAIRLACAGAIARSSRPWDESKRRHRSRGLAPAMRAAVLATAVVGVAYAWYAKSRPSPSLAPAAGSPARRPDSHPPTSGGQSSAAVFPKATSPPESAPSPAPKATLPNPPVALGKVTPPVVTVPAPASKATPSNPPVALGKSPPLVVTVPAPAPKATLPNPPVALKKSPPPVVTVPAPAPKATLPNPPAALGKPTPPVVKTPPPAPKAAPPDPPVVSGAKTPSSDTAKIAKRPSLQAPVPAAPKQKPPAQGPVVIASNGVPRAHVQPLVTAPAPNTAAPTVPQRAQLESPSPAVVGRPFPARPGTQPEPILPAVRLPVKKVEAAPPALNPPAHSTDKPEAGRTARAPSSAGSAASRGPMPPLLKDAVPKVTAILVSSDRRFATIDDGQIIGIGDLLGRRTVVGMDERSVLLQEPSGVQIRIGLGGRLLGIERATR